MGQFVQPSPNQQSGLIPCRDPKSRTVLSGGENLVKALDRVPLTASPVFLPEVANEAHSQRAKPRRRPRDPSWRWKLVETQTVSTACPVDPRGDPAPPSP